MSGPVKIGAFYEIAHPFIIDDYSGIDENGPFTIKSWRPGIRYDDWDQAVADGIGMQRLTVVSIHMPGRYPTRIFYTREWVSPVGKTFGRPRLLIATQSKFSRIVNGYRIQYALAKAIAA